MNISNHFLLVQNQETISDTEIRDICDILKQYSDALYDECRLAVANVLTKNATLFVTSSVPVISKYVFF